MKTGEVHHWKNFPYQTQGRQKDRYIIVLGDTGLLTEPKQTFICTPTTQLQRYEPGNDRASNCFFRFLQKDFSAFFPDECVVDFTLPMLPILQENEWQKVDVSLIGTLPVLAQVAIYGQISASKTCSKAFVRAVADSLGRIGVTGLKKP